MARITDEERLRLENEELRRILQEFSALSPVVRAGTEERLAYLVNKSRNKLRALASQKRPPKTGDPLEHVCMNITRYVVMFTPVERSKLIVCLDRLSPHTWEAYLDEYEHLGIGRGRTGLEAAQRLHSTVKQLWQRALKPIVHL